MSEKFPTTKGECRRGHRSRSAVIGFTIVLLLSATQLASSVLEASGTLVDLTWARRLSSLDHHPLLLLTDLDPKRADRHWERIRALHPLYAPAWIRLGLDHEMAGRTAEAERTLVHAAMLDHSFLPEWTLANFFYRQGREDLFWTHTRRAISHYQSDLSGVFQLCLRIDEDPVRVWERLSPTYAPARMDLIRVLLSNGRLSAAARIADLLASADLRDTRELLLGACDQASAQGEADAAITFWNAAARHGWIARPVLDVARGVVLADGAFHYQPTGACFDWRLVRQDGVSFRVGAPAGMEITLTGHQAATTALAAVRVPVESNRRYRLSWRYTTELDGNSAPLIWRIDGVSAGTWQYATAIQEASIEFNSGARRLIDLSLGTSPAIGTTRPQGRLRLDWIAIAPEGSSSSLSNHL